MSGRALAAGALAAGLVVMGAAPALARGTWSCGEVKHVCMWEDAAGQGSTYVDQVADPGNYEIDWWDGDNEISSVYNATDCTVVIYSGDRQTGKSLTIGPGRLINTLKDYNFNDDAESYKIYKCP